VNVTGVLNGCHSAYPYLRRTPGARVVNLASASAIYGQPELATYSATKFAVRGLTEALDLEWAGDDITVRAIWPLFVNTGMVTGMDTGATRSLGIKLTAQDVADAVYAAAQPGGHGVHHAVGRQARLMLTSSQLTPSWLLRVVNKRVAGRS
jgi:short-subunit dehydrogenase